MLVCSLELINHPGEPLEDMFGGGVSNVSEKTVVWAFSRKEVQINNKVKINFLMIMILGCSEYALGWLFLRLVVQKYEFSFIIRHSC